ncbi:MATH domain and coiled-coil domain-containing protein At3g58370-like isoform X2 [Rosa rugosa]|uniref:MATH domain and coiled-coil domain-containing protein At3g58370-like isoform X2 n=1 Tax=Rosa rugosa TaxID=74645 RepID=UPI002B404456|nr:MATH domain and coiled-coil domain-containing protein At3g58370-like isoform X2 [Rosa rugosa]
MSIAPPSTLTLLHSLSLSLSLSVASRKHIQLEIGTRMYNQQEGHELISMTYTWTIDNFSKIKTRRHYSDGFVVGDFKWRIVVYPKGSNGRQYLSMYLNVADASKLPSGWSRYADFNLTVVNQFNSDKSITIDTQHQFSANKSDWGFTSFMPLSELFDPNEGYLVNDTCIVEAEVAVSKADIKVLKDQQETAFLEQELQSQSSDVDSVKYSDASTTHTSLCYEQTLSFQDAINSDSVQPNVNSVKVPSLKIDQRSDRVLPYQETDSPVGHPIVEDNDEAPSTPVGELIDFRGLGKVDKAFVPLLEEVCSWHPSLISCQRKRSRMFSGWAFTALGRLLHFLNTAKVKDMMEDPREHDPCEHLQVLWEEVETFRFDLSWLEPYVQSALGMKKLGEREGILKKLREDVDALDTEMKRLRERLSVAEVDHAVAKRNLAKAEENFGEANLNRKLGYGRH